MVVVALLAGSAEARRPPVSKEPRPELKKLRELGPGIDLVETINLKMHVHGGKPATINAMAVNVRVHDGKPHAIAIDRVQMLRANCNNPAGTWDSRVALRVAGLELYDWDYVAPESSGKEKVTTPAKNDLYQVKVALSPAEAYQACDRFAFAFRAEVDGTKVTLELPLSVMREEPLRNEP